MVSAWQWILAEEVSGKKSIDLSRQLDSNTRVSSLTTACSYEDTVTHSEGPEYNLAKYSIHMIGTKEQSRNYYVQTSSNVYKKTVL